MEIEVSVTGAYRPEQGPSYSSGGEPAEYPEIEYEVPTACTHEPDAEYEFAPGPYTDAEVQSLIKAIDAAIQAMNDNYDGPDEDFR
jgi:hypothetical protein